MDYKNPSLGVNYNNNLNHNLNHNLNRDINKEINLNQNINPSLNSGLTNNFTNLEYIAKINLSPSSNPNSSFSNYSSSPSPSNPDNSSNENNSKIILPYNSSLSSITGSYQTNWSTPTITNTPTFLNSDKTTSNVDEKIGENEDSSKTAVLKKSSIEEIIQRSRINRGYVPNPWESTNITNYIQYEGKKFSYTFNPAYLYNSRPDISGYVFLPLKLSITRVPKYAIGEGILGRTWTNSGIIEILDTLEGNAFLEVATHEIEHNLYPELSEMAIRQKTKQKLWFNPIFH